MKTPSSHAPRFVGIISLVVCEVPTAAKRVDFFSKDRRIAAKVSCAFERFRLEGVRPFGGPEIIYFVKDLPTDAIVSVLASLRIRAREFIPGLRHWIAPAGSIPC